MIKANVLLQRQCFEARSSVTDDDEPRSSSRGVGEFKYSNFDIVWNLAIGI